MAGRTAPKPSIAFGLSWIAGFIDAAGYIALYHVYVANMSGNTIAIGLQAAQRSWDMLFRHGAAIPFFVVGLLISKWSIYVADRRRFAFLPAFIYALEALLIGLFFVVAKNGVPGETAEAASALEYYLLVGLLSVAMGLQNALHTHFGPLSLHTTHVTGTLAQFADEFARFMVWFNERLRWPMSRRISRVLAASKRQRSLRNAGILAAVWLCYAIGGAMAALLVGSWGLMSLLAPTSFLIFLSAANVINPALLPPPAKHS